VPRLRVLAAHRRAGLLGDRLLVEELQCGRSGDDLDTPAPVAREFDRGADRAGWASAAHDERQDAALRYHVDAPMLLANCSASRRILAGARTARSRTRLRTEARAVISWGAVCSATRSVV
jgi:hypothetical protein